MQTDILTLIQKQLESIGVQMLLLAKPYDTISQFDYHFRSELFQDYDYSDFIPMIKEAAVPKTILHFQEYFCLHYTLFAFPEPLRKEYGAEYCLIGPVMFQPLSDLSFQQIIDTLHVSQEHYQDIREFYNRIPIIPSSGLWYSLLHPLLTTLLGDSVTFQPADFENPSTFLFKHDSYQIKPSSDVSIAALEARYQTESAFMDAVMRGDSEKAFSLQHKFIQFKIVPRVADPVRNLKNLLFVQNTLLRKAVQASHVHPYHIDHLSTQFAIQIETATSISQLNIMAHDMVRKYCLMVTNYSRGNYSSLIQFCLDYIDLHYNEELSLEILAKRCSVSAGYLSGLFHKETGSTLTDHINSIRIRQSLILLNSTKLSIQEIAVQCGYQDGNYFARTFKRIHGMTPTTYRKEINKTYTAAHSFEF